MDEAHRSERSTGTPERARFLRPFHGAYLAGTAHPDLLARARAALHVCPPGTAVGYDTAAALFGFGLGSDERIHVVVPAGTPFPQRRGIVTHQSTVDSGPPVVVLGVPCVPAARCAIDLVRSLRRLDGLPVLDAALRCGACSMEQLEAEVRLHKGLRGVVKARELLPLADPRAQCRQETQLRLVLHDAGLTGFQPQVPVLDDDGLVRYYLDLADPRTKVAAEYDGASHLDRRQLRRDRRRHNWLETRGWRMRYFTDDDLYRHPDSIVDTLRQASARRSRE